MAESAAGLFVGNATLAQIARELSILPATVSRILRRRGLNKLSALEPAEPIRHYEREKAGELIHRQRCRLAGQ